MVISVIETIKDKFYYLIGIRRANRLKRLFMSLNLEINNEIKKNLKYKNAYDGKKCFIIGNGPSVKNINFEDLSNEYTFTVNQFTRFNNFDKINPNFHVFSDERIFCLDENVESDREALKYLNKLEDCNPVIFSKYNSKNYIENSNYFKNLNINYYVDGLVFYEKYELDYDITKQIPWFPTCVDYCIFIAMYMGFKEIYLLGCECTGFLKVATIDDTDNKKNYSYGYNITKNEEDRIKKQLLNRGSGDELEVWSKILRYYDYIKEFAEKCGVKIINCTDGGILTSFERKKLNDVLKK